MISHALHIIVNELNAHFLQEYSSPTAEKVLVGNIGMGIGGTGTGSVPSDRMILTLINYKEEKTLKNLPNYVRNDVTLKVSYENPPVFLNFLILLTATHVQYKNALIDLSRVIRFFQSQNVFNPDNVRPTSLTPDSGDLDPSDHLESFKLIFDLYSPTLEEVNHMWGILGSKEYPFVLYMMRMMDLKFKAVQSESGLITVVQSDFYQKNPQ